MFHYHAEGSEKEVYLFLFCFLFFHVNCLSNLRVDSLLQGYTEIIPLL